MAKRPGSHAQDARSDWTAYAPLDASLPQQLAAGGQDVLEGLRRHRAWRYLASEQIKNQYRRTVIGPWWLTLQSMVYVLGLALIFGQLQGAALEDFLPYVAVGFLTFTLLAGMVRSGANVYVQQASTLKSTRQPLSSLVLRGVMVELIQFLHNAVIIALLFAFVLIDPSVWLLLAPVALLVVLVNGLLVGLWLGAVVARFRDVGPAVDSILQVLVFFSPVFYRASDLAGAEALVRANPFTYFIDLVREPVLGDGWALVTVGGAAGFTLGNLVLAALVFSRARSRVPYWVA